MEIGHKIKKVRELRNFTQEYMATQLSLSQEGYSKIEADKTKVSLERIEQIAKVLNIDLLDLLNFDEKYVFNNFSSFQQNIKNEYGKSTEVEKELYERIIEQQKTEIEFLRNILKTKQ